MTKGIEWRDPPPDPKPFNRSRMKAWLASRSNYLQGRPTPGEQKIQDLLDLYAIPYSQQAPVLGKYLADFLVEDGKVILEIDSTRSRKRRHIARDAELSAAGYRVVRVYLRSTPYRTGRLRAPKRPTAPARGNG